MKIKSILFVISIVFVLFSSCKSLKDSIVGHWYIEELFYNGAPIHYQYISTGLSFNKDLSCDLPFTLDEYYLDKFKTGSWKLIHKSKVYYIKIETENPIFNTVYEIKRLEKKVDPKSGGNYAELILVSPASKIKCIKQLYY